MRIDFRMPARMASQCGDGTTVPKPMASPGECQDTVVLLAPKDSPAKLAELS